MESGGGHLDEQRAGSQQEPVEFAGAQQLPGEIIEAPAEAFGQPEGSDCQRVNEDDVGHAPIADIPETGE
ncbi:hypothetical protein D3C73_1398500 [compost metagenome]